MAASEPIIREYRAGDEAGILQLFEEVFGYSRGRERWEWQYQNNPQGAGWITVAEQENQIVGHVAIVRMDLNFLGRQVPGGQTCDFMVRSDQRGQGLTTKLLNFNNHNAEQQGLRAMFGFPNRGWFSASTRIQERHRITHMDYYYYRVGLRKLLGPHLDKVLKLCSRLQHRCTYLVEKKRQTRSVEIQVGDHLPEVVEDLLKAYRYHGVFGVWKDLPYLRWRYERHPEYPYTFHLLYSGDRVDGLAVCRVHEDAVAICEMIHRTRDLRQSVLLLKHILAYYAGLSAQKIEFYGADTGFFRTIFSVCGFSYVPYSELVFTGRPFGDQRFQQMFILPHNWTLTYGDLDVI
jgi:predicted N-acetyltransferase YhbS